MVSEQPWAHKGIFWVFEKMIFQLLANFWVTKLKPFSGKVRQSIRIYLNQNLVVRNVLESACEATLSLKKNVFRV